jgi:hypothetical protein
VRQISAGQQEISKGRRGSRNKLGEKFLDALLAEWRRSGKKALEKLPAMTRLPSAR